MQDYRVRLIARIARTPTVESFRFAPDQPFDFLPGQFLQVIFDGQNRDNKELNKYLSLSCAPGLPYIEVTKRLSASVFSNRLRNIKTGDAVTIKGPLGNCVYRTEYERIGFLIGGIGITPVISIVEYIVGQALGTDVVLVYSNRTEEEIAFKHQLDQWQSGHKNIKIFYLVSECQPKDQTCVYGTINKAMLQTQVCDARQRMFYIFGPPKMVEAMRLLAVDMQCSLENIKTESFIGY